MRARQKSGTLWPFPISEAVLNAEIEGPINLMQGNKLRKLLIIFFCIFFSNTYARVVNYDTSAQSGRTTIITYGSSNFETYGQTFFAPNSAVEINSFEFYFIPDYGANLFSKAYIYRWDGFKAIGAPVYEATSSINAANEGWIKVNTGSTSVISGLEYVAFFTLSNPDVGVISTGSAGFGGVIGGYDASVDGGGHFVAIDNGLNFSLLTQNEWWQAPDWDMRWKASFSTGPADVPEPLTIGGSMVMCAWLYLIRRRIAVGQSTKGSGMLFTGR